MQLVTQRGKGQYLTFVLDLFSRRVIGWPLQTLIKKEIVLDALLTAV